MQICVKAKFVLQLNYFYVYLMFIIVSYCITLQKISMNKIVSLRTFKKQKEECITIPLKKELIERHKLYRRLIKWTQRGRIILLGIKE